MKELQVFHHSENLPADGDPISETRLVAASPQIEEEVAPICVWALSISDPQPQVVRQHRSLPQTADFHMLRTPVKVRKGSLLVRTRVADLVPGIYKATVMLRDHPKTEAVAEPPLESLNLFLDRVKREHIQAAMERADGNGAEAARLLGINARTVYRLWTPADRIDFIT